VLDHDARNARAAAGRARAALTTAARNNNLNASSHVRAVLTDLFLLDDTLQRQSQRRTPRFTIVRAPRIAPLR
jgi:hypothetical protein